MVADGINICDGWADTLRVHRMRGVSEEVAGNIMAVINDVKETFTEEIIEMSRQWLNTLLEEQGRHLPRLAE